MNKNWISINNRKPKPLQRVLVKIKHEGTKWDKETHIAKKYTRFTTTMAEYIPYRSVLAEDYISEDFTNDSLIDYDEENDINWTAEGWFEWQFVPDMNWFIDEQITHWMPIPQFKNKTRRIKKCISCR